MPAEVGTLQAQLALDFKDFSAGMSSAIEMVKSLGKQLQKALGSSAAQGFSTTNKEIGRIQQSIRELQSTAATFSATMANVNTNMKQFTAVKNNTSALGDSVAKASRDAKGLSSNVGDISPNVKKATGSANSLSSSLGTANGNAKKTGSSIQSAAKGAGSASANAKSLSNNLSGAYNFARDLKRIIGGIVISQTFYRLLGVVTDLVSASADFMNNMAQSSIAFKYLLGDAASAKSLLTSLQDFAISSPLDMTGATNSARMLMTMGFQAKSVVSVLGTITDAATVAGGDMESTVDRISLALGQMLQSGTVKMQEVRQLVNANIPIYDILQSELGLTAEQVSKIGDVGVSSSKAVIAILTGLQKRFGGAGKEMQTTIPGALSAIKDSFYSTFNIVMAGPYEQFRRSLVSLSNRMQDLTGIARKLGAGGVFESIFPPRLHAVLRNVIGAFGQLGLAMRFMGKIALQIFSATGEIILSVLNIILPPIAIAANAITQITYALMNAFPFIKYFASALLLLGIARPVGAILLWFWKVIGIGSLITRIIGYVQLLVKWLGVLAITCLHHPAILVIALVSLALLTLTGNTQKAINKMKELFGMLGKTITTSNKTINSATGLGYDPSTIAQPTVQSAQDDASSYTATLADLASQLDTVGDSADAAGKKVKDSFNQSFDEVYLIDPSASSDLGLSGLSNIDLSEPLSTLADFNSELADLGKFNFGDGWADNFMAEWGKMWANIKGRIFSGNGVVAILAGLSAGLLTGNPWVGLAVTLAGLFWPEISKQLGLTQENGSIILGTAVTALVAAAIASLSGLGWGAILITAGLAAVGYTIGNEMGNILSDSLGVDLELRADMFNIRIVGDVVAAIAAAAAVALGILDAPIGIAIAVGIGVAEMCYPIGQKIYEVLSGAGWKDYQINSMAIISAIAGVIGLVVGGPLGAAIGVAIGAALGTGGAWVAEVITQVAELIKAGDWDILGEAIRLSFVDAFTAVFNWDLTSYLVDCMVGSFSDAVTALKQGKLLTFGQNIVEGLCEGILGAIFFIGEPVWDLFTSLCDAIATTFGIHSPATEMKPFGKNILLGILEGIVESLGEVPGYIGVMATSILDAARNSLLSTKDEIFTFFLDVKNSTKDFVSSTSKDIADWSLSTGQKVFNWAANTRNDIASWSSDTATDIWKWATGTKDNISAWAGDTGNNISNWVGSTRGEISGWWDNVGGILGNLNGVSFSSWCDSTFSDIRDWSSNVWSTINDNLGNAIDKVKSFLGLSHEGGEFSVSTTFGGGGSSFGHASGGIFNREHWAHFAEGNKAEAIIPLQNDSAMQPFVDAVSNGLTATLAPIVASLGGGQSNGTPIYVGTLIADENGIKELERKMYDLRIQEERRS